MNTLMQGLALLTCFILYWVDRKRRRHLKSRIGNRALTNIYEISRNIGFMFNQRPLIVEECQRIKTGAVFYSFHFGLWELMPVTIKQLGHPVGIIANHYHRSSQSGIGRLADRLLYRFRSRNGIKVFYKEDVLKIVRFVRCGGVLGMLVDGDTFYAKLDKAQRLARICKVPLIPFAAYLKNGVGRLEIGCNLMKLVGERPLDYLWAYKSRSEE